MLKDLNSKYNRMFQRQGCMQRYQYRLQNRESDFYKALYAAHLFIVDEVPEEHYELYHRYVDYYMDLNTPRLFKRRFE